MESTDNVPVIPQNLQDDEIIIDITESLNSLSQVVKDIGKKVNDGIRLNSNDLSNLMNKINTVNQKLNAMNGVKKDEPSTQYPAANISQQYESVVNDKDCPKTSRYTAKYKDPGVKEEQLADYLRYVHGSGPGIAPSVMTTPNIPDLPEIVKKESLGGGDSMADLHGKLMLTRKGISGTKNPDGAEPPTGAMKKISAMISPPPAKIEQSESAATDDDWGD